MPAPYTALTYGDPSRQKPALTTYNYVYQDYPWWMGSTFGTGTAGTTYSQKFTTGGVTPLAIALQSGTLPPGLGIYDVGTIPGVLFELSGIPTTPGSFSFTLRASNAVGFQDREFTVVIGSGPSAGGGGGAWTFAA